MEHQKENASFKHVNSTLTEKTRCFEEWIRNRSEFCSKRIQLQQIPSDIESRGLFATEDIAEDELLFTLNRSLILTAENSDLTKLISEEDLDPWLSLILVVMNEWSRATNSLWKPYLDVLPINSTKFQPLMFWPQNSLIDLQESPVLKRIGKEETDETFFSILLPILEKNKDVLHSRLFPESEVYISNTLLPLYHSAGSVIMAYAFDIEKDRLASEKDEDGFVSEDEDEFVPKGLVPMADMLNADADMNNARLFYEDSTLSMRAIKPIKAGQEIYNDYGPLPRSELLRRYGYVTQRYERFDVAELPIDLILELAEKKYGVTHEIAHQKVSFLESQSCLEDGYDITHFNRESETDNISELPEYPFGPELICLVNVLLLPQAAFDAYKQRRKLPKDDLLRNTLAIEILELLGHACREQRAKYSTTMDEDLHKYKQQTQFRDEARGHMEHLSSSDNLQQLQEETSEYLRNERYRHALEVRLGEKTVLKNAEVFAQVMASHIKEDRAVKKRAAEGPASHPESKKLKSEAVTSRLRDLLGGNS